VQVSFKKLLALLAHQIHALEQQIAALVEKRSVVAGTQPNLPQHQGRGPPHRDKAAKYRAELAIMDPAALSLTH
jgi:hypothetical protein